jgi:hypothetical protein
MPCGSARPGDGVEDRAALRVDHFDGVVAQRRDEEALMLGVEGHVIDPSPEAGKRDSLLKADKRSGLAFGDHARESNVASIRMGRIFLCCFISILLLACRANK